MLVPNCEHFLFRIDFCAGIVFGGLWWFFVCFCVVWRTLCCEKEEGYNLSVRHFWGSLVFNSVGQVVLF